MPVRLLRGRSLFLFERMLGGLHRAGKNTNSGSNGIGAQCPHGSLPFQFEHLPIKTYQSAQIHSLTEFKAGTVISRFGAVYPGLCRLP